VKIPKTTPEKPYIEFKITKRGKLKLTPSATFWGGKNSGFVSTDGSEGNTCKPKDLKVYLNAYKERKIKIIENEILTLQKKLEKVKGEIENWNF
jgi:hypothetical protein